jgi:hypothetical protein
VTIDSKDGACHLTAASTDKSGQSHDLAAANLEADVGEDALAREPAYLESGVSAAGLLLGVQEVEVAPHHSTNEIGGGQAFEWSVRHDSPIAHDRDPLAEGEDLIEPMRDEEQGGALGTEGAHHIEEAVDLGRRERGCRLVHDDDPRVERQRLDDLNDLLVCDGEASSRAVRVEWHPQAAHQPPDTAVHFGTVDPPPTGEGLTAHEDVLGNRQVGEQGGLLVDDRDTRRASRCRPAEVGVVAVQDETPGIRAMHTGDQLDDGGFACAVLTHQAVHLARSECYRHVLDGPDGAERLGDAVKCEQGSHLS